MPSWDELRFTLDELRFPLSLPAQKGWALTPRQSRSGPKGGLEHLLNSTSIGVYLRLAGSYWMSQRLLEKSWTLE